MRRVALRVERIRQRAAARCKTRPRSFHDYVGTRQITWILRAQPTAIARLDLAAVTFAEAAAALAGHHIVPLAHPARLLLATVGQPLSNEPDERAFLRMLQTGETAFQAIAMALVQNAGAEALDRCAALLEGPCLAGLNVTMRQITPEGFARFGAVTGNISAGESWAYARVSAAFADAERYPRGAAALKTWKRLHLAAVIKTLGAASIDRDEVRALKRGSRS